MIYPFMFIEYNKTKAQQFLKENYGWEYYGGHHHENSYTKFAISYWLYSKFNIDKRIITLSAQIISGEIEREQALSELKMKPYNPETIDSDIKFILSKLDMTSKEFEEIWSGITKSFIDYPNYHNIIEKMVLIIKPMMYLFLPQMPSYFTQLEMRKNKKYET